MACVTSLTTGLDGTCEAVKKAGGVNKNIYAGSVKDIDSVTFGTEGDITAITFKSAKVLVKFTGRIAKNTASEPVTAEGEGNVEIYTHTVSPVLYHYTQAERKAIEDLFSLDNAFFIVPMRSGQIVVYGISNDAETIQDFGLKVSEADDAVGTALNDQNAQTATFTGEMLHKAILFDESATYADNITTIEGYLTNP